MYIYIYIIVSKLSKIYNFTKISKCIKTLLNVKKEKIYNVLLSGTAICIYSTIKVILKNIM